MNIPISSHDVYDRVLGELQGLGFWIDPNTDDYDDIWEALTQCHLERNDTPPPKEETMRIGTRVRIPGNPGQRGVIQGRFCDGRAYLVGFADGSLLKVKTEYLREEK